MSLYTVGLGVFTTGIVFYIHNVWRNVAKSGWKGANPSKHTDKIHNLLK